MVWLKGGRCQSCVLQYLAVCHTVRGTALRMLSGARVARSLTVMHALRAWRGLAVLHRDECKGALPSTPAGLFRRSVAQYLPELQPIWLEYGAGTLLPARPVWANLEASWYETRQKFLTKADVLDASALLPEVCLRSLLPQGTSCSALVWLHKVTTQLTAAPGKCPR